MKWQINVAKCHNPKAQHPTFTHLFTASPPDSASAEEATALFRDLVIKYPPADMFAITLTRWSTEGVRLDRAEPLLPMPA